MKLVVNGARGIEEVPGLESARKHVEIVFAPNEAQLGCELPGADVLLGWNFRGRDLRNQWAYADQLQWVHWCGAGVDAVLFPELVASTTVLTNARGIFDRAMTEYVLGYMLAEVKGLRTTLQSQSERTWNFRMTEKLAGSRAVIFGVGSIGREIGTVLAVVGVDVVGVGRRRRDGDPVFEEIHAQTDALDVAANADWVVGVMPLTDQTRGFFDSAFFKAMKPTARFINVGRGQSVVENDLAIALQDNVIAGAMLDVFNEEPVPVSSSLWDVPNLMVSPHMSGDYSTAEHDMVKQFLANLEKFVAGESLANVVNKDLGFVETG